MEFFRYDQFLIFLLIVIFSFITNSFTFKTQISYHKEKKLVEFL